MLKKSFVRGKNLKIPDYSVYDMLMHRSKINASKIICRCHEDYLTFAQLKTDSEIYAKAFLELGIKAGDIVPICTEPSCTAMVLFLALNRIGAITTFINATANIKEIKRYVKRFKSDIFIYSDKLSIDIDLLHKECSLKKSIVIKRNEIYKKYQDISALTRDYLNGDDCNDNISIIHSELYRLGELSLARLAIHTGKDIPAFITYTSGTTGEPKAILLSNGNINAEMLSLKKTTLMQYGPQGNSLQVVPFNYPYGFIITALFPIFAGKTAALTPALTVDTIADYLKMYKPTYISAIPSFYKSFLSDKEIDKMDLSFLKYPISGGDVITKTEIEKINVFLKNHGARGKLLNGNGNGEGCGSLTNPLALFGKYNINSIGKPIYGLSVKFTDENGETVELNKTGRFCFAGKNVMLEYFNDEIASKNVKYIDNDGIEWFHTDTYGHIDSKKWVYFEGRERRFFITYDSDGSPYKVYCDHVQNTIKQHREVVDCVVVKKPDEKRYLVPIAFVVANNSNNEKLIDEIAALCRNELQGCAVPCEYIFIEKIPLLTSGKIDYRTLENIANKSNLDDIKH